MPSATRTQPTITVRLARADEGPALEALYASSGKPPLPFVSWFSDVSPFWLVAVDEDGVGLGCINVRISKPVAQVEELCIPLTLSKRIKARVMWQLTQEALRVCASYGVQAAQFSLDTRIGDWERIVQRHGAVLYNNFPNFIIQV